MNYNQLLHELDSDNIPLLTNSQLKFLDDVNSLMDNKIHGSADVVFPGAVSDDDKIKDFEEQVRVLEENFKTIINSLKKGRSARKTFLKVYPKWIKVRKDGTTQLKEIAESINKDRFNCNVSKVVGYSVSLTGGFITIASSVLIPFTLGLSTPLAIAGGSMIATGCTTAIGTSVTEFVLLKQKVEKAQEILEEDKKYFNEMSDWLTHSRQLEEAIAEVLKLDIVLELAKSVEKFVEEAFSITNQYKRFNFMRNRINDLFKLFPQNFQVAIPLTTIAILVTILIAFYLLLHNSGNRLVFDCASLTIRSILGIASLLDDSMDVMRLTSLFTGSAMAAKDLAKAVTRGAVAVVGVALDVAAIALTSIDIHKGSISPEAEKIANAVIEMEEETETLQKVYDNLT